MFLIICVIILSEHDATEAKKSLDTIGTQLIHKAMKSILIASSDYRKLNETRMKKCQIYNYRIAKGACTLDNNLFFKETSLEEVN